MLKSPYLFAVNVLLALLHWTGAAKAQSNNLGLSFELPPAQEQAVVLQSPPASPELPTSPELIVPAQPSARIEIATADMTSELTAALTSEGPTELEYTTEPLPPIETMATGSLMEAEPQEQAIDTDTSAADIALTFSADTVSLEGLEEQDEHAAQATDNDTPSLSELQASAIQPSATPITFDSTELNNLSLDDWIFEHGTNSLVARTVGSAEGTRHARRRRTRAYYGHVDPGNGVWNLGTFSYQHEAASPEEADERQLQRLKRQGLQLEDQARELGITLSLEEKLNGLDLANQAPLAALDKGGYIERLAQARRLQMETQEAILWARTYAYIDPNTRKWNAPGLGNNVQSISRDQERRISAISKAMRAYEPSDMKIASLDTLEEMTLESTTRLGGSRQASGNALTGGANTYRSETAASSPMEVSFELPAASESVPTAASTLAAALQASVINRGEPSAMLEQRSTPASNSKTANREADVDNTVEIESLGVVPTSNELDDMAVAFSPTNNLADPLEKANPTEQGVPSDLAPSAAIPEETALFEINAEPAVASDSNARTPSPTLTSAETDSAAAEVSASPQPIAEGAPQLQSLLSGIGASRITPEERAKLLQQNSPEPKSEITLWSTEDRIVSPEQ